MDRMDTYKVNKLIEKYSLPYKVGVHKDKKRGYFSLLYWVDQNGRQGVVCANPGKGTYKPLIEELSKVGPAGQALLKEFNEIYHDGMMFTPRVNKLIEKYSLPYKVGVHRDKQNEYISVLYWIDQNGQQNVMCTNQGNEAYKPLIEELSKVGPAGQALLKEFNEMVNKSYFVQD